MFPPEPKLVAWYFGHREGPGLSGVWASEQVARNEGLWGALCEGGLETARELVEGLSVNNPTDDPLDPVNTRRGPPRAIPRAIYMREYMRRRRGQG